ncbi:hypothetical protein HED60_08825 [Planctomycetales bacterium ZRK34]|nr:hypothetical protein HED60_08825 [Planctomycetales bacterium ZRK34]
MMIEFIPMIVVALLIGLLVRWRFTLCVIAGMILLGLTYTVIYWCQGAIPDPISGGILAGMIYFAIDGLTKRSCDNPDCPLAKIGPGGDYVKQIEAPTGNFMSTR